MISMILTLTSLIVIGDPLSVRVDGEGYLRFIKGSTVVYSTTAKLSIKGGLVVNQDSLPVIPKINAGDMGDLLVEIDGTVIVSGRYAGRLVLSNFTEETAFKKTGSYLTTNAAGVAGNPGEGIFGVIRTDRAPSASKPVVDKNSPLRIVVRPVTEVSNTNISLGDISEIFSTSAQRAMLEKIDLGPAPTLGSERLIATSYVMAKLRAVGVDPDKSIIEVPEGARVVRRSNRVEPQALIDAAISQLKTQFEINMPLKCVRQPNPATVSPGKLELKSTILRHDGQSVEVSINIIVDGKLAGNRLVAFEPEASATPSPNATPNPGPALAVRSGETVKVKFVKNGAIIESTGRALASVALGQSLSISTLPPGASSTVTLNAKAVAPGVVEVQI